MAEAVLRMARAAEDESRVVKDADWGGIVQGKRTLSAEYQARVNAAKKARQRAEMRLQELKKEAARP